MMFLESPWPALLLGIAAEAILLVILVRSGRGVLLWAIGGVALLTALAVVVEQLIPTHRKQVTATLQGAAAALEANDLERLLETISPAAADTRAAARWALDTALFVQLQIRNLEIAINSTTSPPTARTTFTAVATGRDRRGEIEGVFSRPVRMEVDLRRESGRWLITAHRFLDEEMQKAFPR
ncbi:MAG: hypothetical protein ABSF26_14005 [Thermoguttaceae bacterium]|jgi:hypothetical protein